VKELAISIVIPTRNHPELLACCLTSLQQAQSPKEAWEVLIMDNSDEIFRSKNLGVVNSFANAHFRYVSMTD